MKGQVKTCFIFIKPGDTNDDRLDHWMNKVGYAHKLMSPACKQKTRDCINWQWTGTNCTLARFVVICIKNKCMRKIFFPKLA